MNPSGEPTTWYVEYGTSTSYGTKTATADAGSGTSAKAVSIGVTRAERRQDLPLPARRDELGGHGAGSRRARSCTARAARSHDRRRELDRDDEREAERQVDPNGRATTYLFEYGTTTVVRDEDVERERRLRQNSATNVSQNVTGLSRAPPTTTASSRRAMRARSRAPTRRSRRRARRPQSTGQASGVGPTSATLGGSVNPNGRSTSWYIEYGTSTSYGSRTSSRSAGSGTAALAVSVGRLRLKAGVTYHFRLVATSSLGTREVPTPRSRRRARRLPSPGPSPSRHSRSPRRA